MSAGRTPAYNRRGTGTCWSCGKVCYRSRDEAKAAKRVLHPSEKMHAYRCGNNWHFGHDELWREFAHDDLIWHPLPDRARAQILAMARITFNVQRGAA